MNNCFYFIRIAVCLLSFSLLSTQAHAIKWTKLNSNKTSTLLLDKGSVSEKNKLKKAWLKIEYKKTQTNSIEPDKKYNLSKVLWYFKCDAQQSATSQVAQYLDKEMVFSAGIDVKKAEFIDPLPESDVDIAMRYVCNYDPVKEKADREARIAKKKADAAAKKKAEKDEAEAKKIAFEQAEKDRIKQEAEDEAKMEALAKEAEKGHGSKKSKRKYKKKKRKGKKDKQSDEWAYKGDNGPAHWGTLKYKYASCKTGRNQSPINIDQTIKAKLGKIRSIRKLPGKEILHNGHGIQINFDFGNMMVLDKMPYQMKHVEFHTPAENTIHGDTYALEAQFFHADSDGNKAIVSVLFKEGKSNKELAKLLLQLPTKKGKKKKLNKRIRAKDLMPSNPRYYRYSGSLTTPPCSEGVKWVVFKTALTASTAQIEKLENALAHTNSRPVQPLYGRVVLE